MLESAAVEKACQGRGSTVEGTKPDAAAALDGCP
jgi:hypothetical protein